MSRGRILVVDDESEIREMLSRNFRFLGFDVIQASDGKDALRQLQSTPVDIVVTDISMPGMDGIELTGEIRIGYPMVKVIVMTGYVTVGNLLATIRHGAENIIFKPLGDLTEMEESVESAYKQITRWKTKLQQLTSLKRSE